jgi:NAD(P)-dependent dehydrogenase (short-subunit alcohol dehydrogenase family)
MNGLLMSEPSDILSGKTALVTGASRRLGRAITLALARQGAGIVVHYNRSEQAADALCNELHRMGASVCKAHADLSDNDQTGGLFKDAVAQAGPIDILINNASIFDKETIWETTEASLQRNLQIHSVAPLVLARAVARQGRPAQIVNLLDTRVTIYDREHASYHLSKRVLLTLTRMLALELAPTVTVNAVAPGLILPPAGQDESYLEKLAHCNPLNRYGSPDDITAAVLFLLRSRFVTGQVIYVDGGYHMKGHMYD